MRFLADECVWRVVVEALRKAGWSGDWIHDIAPSIPDVEVLRLSLAERLLIVSEDGDFGDLVFQRNLAAFGIVRVRLSQFEGAKTKIAETVAGRLAKLDVGLVGRFTTIEPNRTRQRPLPVRVE